MENKQKNKMITILLVVITVILSVLCVLFATGTINLKFNDIDNKLDNNVDNNNSNQNIVENNEFEENKISVDNISEEKLKNIVENQLYILFTHSNPITKLENIDNQSKLQLALTILEDKYTTSSNDIDTTIVSVTKSKLEEAFASSVIGNLGIKHEDFGVYELTGDYIYNRNTNLLVYSKAMYKYKVPDASKVKNYEKKDNQYIISMNYLFPDVVPGPSYYHGSLTDAKNETNPIIKAYDDNNNYLNAQEYLDNNYNSIKDKLATYTYTFELKNDNLVLTNYSVK